MVSSGFCIFVGYQNNQNARFRTIWYLQCQTSLQDLRSKVLEWRHSYSEIIIVPRLCCAHQHIVTRVFHIKKPYLKYITVTAGGEEGHSTLVKNVTHPPRVWHVLCTQDFTLMCWHNLFTNSVTHYLHKSTESKLRTKTESNLYV